MVLPETKLRVLQVGTVTNTSSEVVPAGPVQLKTYLCVPAELIVFKILLPEVVDMLPVQTPGAPTVFKAVQEVAPVTFQVKLKVEESFLGIDTGVVEVVSDPLTFRSTVGGAIKAQDKLYAAPTAPW